jgi:hypothetical protein
MQSVATCRPLAQQFLVNCRAGNARRVTAVTVNCLDCYHSSYSLVCYQVTASTFSNSSCLHPPSTPSPPYAIRYGVLSLPRSSRRPPSDARARSRRAVAHSMLARTHACSQTTFAAHMCAPDTCVPLPAALGKNTAASHAAQCMM